MPYDPGYTTVAKVADIPKDVHNAILEEYSYSQDDGWGNTDTVHAIRYLIFKDDAQLNSWVQANESGVRFGTKPVYRVIQVKPLEVKKTVTIQLG